MESLAASGGYYVSCGGKYLMANETSITGSIGVIIQTLNYEQLFNKIGPRLGRFQKREIQGHAQWRAPDHAGGARLRPGFRHEDLRASFSASSRRSAMFRRTRLRNGIADGRILSGRDALDNKLIDGLGQIEDAYRESEGTRAARPMRRS